MKRIVERKIPALTDWNRKGKSNKQEVIRNKKGAKIFLVSRNQITFFYADSFTSSEKVYPIQEVTICHDHINAMPVGFPLPWRSPDSYREGGAFISLATATCTHQKTFLLHTTSHSSSR